jgi:hypothetical protein
LTSSERHRSPAERLDDLQSLPITGLKRMSTRPSSRRYLVVPLLAVALGVHASPLRAIEPGWAVRCGDGRVDLVLDAMETVGGWSVCCSDRNRASASLRTDVGCSGQALALDYDFNGPLPTGANWVVIWRTFGAPLDLSGFTHLRLALRAANAAAHHRLEVKLRDASGRMDWFIGESITDVAAWRTIYVDLRSLTCTANCANSPVLQLNAIASIEIGIDRCLRDTASGQQECEDASQNANTLWFDELAAVDLRPGAPHRLAPAAPELVTANAVIRARAAVVLRDKQIRADLAPAWYEESTPNYNTYAQAVRLLVLVREYQLTRDDSFRQAAQRTIAAMLRLQCGSSTPPTAACAPGSMNAGGWFTAYEWNGTRMIPRDGCGGAESAVSDVDRCFWIGNTGWMLMALDRARTTLPGDRTAITSAIDNASAWLLRLRGRLADAPDVITYGLEGNISAYFGLIAARRPEARAFGEAIVQRGWDAIEGRMKIGVLPSDFGIAMDTAGSWGVHLLRSLGREADARLSQSFIASMYRVTSFSGAYEGYADVNGPWTLTVEFGAQGADASIPGAQHVMDQIHALQAADGSFPQSVDDFSGWGAWVTSWHGLAPTAWVYFVHAGSPLQTAYFSDDPLQAGTTTVRAAHVEELRVRIDALRARAGLGNYSWTDPQLVTQATTIRAAHVLDLRAAIDDVYGAAGMTHLPWQDGLVPGTTPIRAVHVSQLRDFVIAMERN